MIFISPTIVDPKTRIGMNKYTIDKIREGDNLVKDSGVYENPRDPITHLFFGRANASQETMDYYVEQSKDTEISPDLYRKKEDIMVREKDTKCRKIKKEKLIR